MSERLVFEFDAIGEPMGKQRPKASAVGGHARVYTPKPTLNYEASVRSAYVSAYAGAEPVSCPIRIRIDAYFGLKKGDYTKKGALGLHGRMKLDGSEKHAKKPDFDNVAKIVTDALNGIAFVDDSLIFDARVTKGYSRVPKVHVAAWAVEPD